MSSRQFTLTLVGAAALTALAFLIITTKFELPPTQNDAMMNCLQFFAETDKCKKMVKQGMFKTVPE